MLIFYVVFAFVLHTAVSFASCGVVEGSRALSDGQLSVAGSVCQWLWFIMASWGTWALSLEIMELPDFCFSFFPL